MQAVLGYKWRLRWLTNALAEDVGGAPDEVPVVEYPMSGDGGGVWRTWRAWAWTMLKLLAMYGLLGVFYYFAAMELSR